MSTRAPDLARSRQIEVPVYGRAVVLHFKHAHFRIQYANGTQRSLKRPEFLRYYAASLE
jgi:hypothetical protein